MSERICFPAASRTPFTSRRATDLSQALPVLKLDCNASKPKACCQRDVTKFPIPCRERVNYFHRNGAQGTERVPQSECQLTVECHGIWQFRNGLSRAGCFLYGTVPESLPPSPPRTEFFPSTSIAKLRRCIGMELEIFSCTPAFEWMGAFIHLPMRSLLTWVKILFSCLSSTLLHCKHVVLEPVVLVMFSFFQSVSLEISNATFVAIQNRGEPLIYLVELSPTNWRGGQHIRIGRIIWGDCWGNEISKVYRKCSWFKVQLALAKSIRDLQVIEPDVWPG